MNGQKTTSLEFKIRESYANLLRELARKTVPYFFFKDISVKDTRLAISAYVVWKHQDQLWHHSAKIDETYMLVDNEYVSDRVTYIFIRSFVWKMCRHFSPPSSLTRHLGARLELTDNRRRPRFSALNDLCSVQPVALSTQLTVFT